MRQKTIIEARAIKLGTEKMIARVLLHIEIMSQQKLKEARAVEVERQEESLVTALPERRGDAFRRFRANSSES